MEKAELDITLDELAHEALNGASKEHPGYFHMLNLENKRNVRSDMIAAVVDQLISNGFVTAEFSKYKTYIKITVKGQKLVKEGGWLFFQRGETEKMDESKKLKILEKEKLQKEVVFLRWKLATFWPVFILAAIGGFCGIISLTIQLGFFSIRKPPVSTKEQFLPDSTVFSPIHEVNDSLLVE